MANTSAQLQPHPDRLFPAEPGQREITRRLYESVKDLPIISPHGHVPPQWLSENTPFEDPTELLITPDHYVNRLLHSHGVPLSALGVGQPDFSAEQSREAFRILCRHWPIYRGTPVRLWFESILADVFGVTVQPSAETADAIYDQIAAALKTPEFTPRALFDRFNISVLATTDDPCDDLSAHHKLATDDTFGGRVVPTFRPDKYLEAAREDWNASMDRLAEVSGIDTSTLDGWIAAMENRRAHFIEHGAVSADHAHLDAGTEQLDQSRAEELYRAFRSGTPGTDEDAAALRRHLLAEQGRMAADDGLVMTIHPAVYRNHHGPSFATYGADVGCDIPIAGEYTRSLQPLLTRFGTAENFQLVLFTIDETLYSREIAPLAGFYPSVYAGVPWWFIDAPDAISRFKTAVTETAGFTKTSGFIDDTRAFCSIPARHDMSRRLDARHLAQLVAEHRLSEDEAHQTIGELVTDNPRKAFKL